VGKYFPPYAGGMETYLRDLMVALAKMGVNNSALVHQSDISFSSSQEMYQRGEQRLSIIRAAVWLKLMFTPISPGFPWLLNRSIKEQQPDLLHFHMPNASVFWALTLPRARKIPWVVHWQSDVLASEYSLALRLFYGIYRPFERAILKRSAAIIASSEPYLESSEALREFREKCTVIPLGLDPSTLAAPPRPSPENTETREKALRVLAVGRLTYYKGFEYLIRALPRCDDVEVHLVGKGDQEASLKSLAAELKVQHRLTFHGHLPPDQLAGQFAECDCLCLPSVERTEAFGLVLLEAMYCGKATVISDVPGSGMGWIVQEGITGLKTPPKDPESLAAALRKLQGDRGRIRSLGQSGRDRFDQQFHIDQSAAGAVELYRKVLLNINRKR
jgi:glycosyltransferase involved in cell wall biosynthesis